MCHGGKKRARKSERKLIKSLKVHFLSPSHKWTGNRKFAADEPAFEKHRAFESAGQEGGQQFLLGLHKPAARTGERTLSRLKNSILIVIMATLAGSKKHTATGNYSAQQPLLPLFRWTLIPCPNH